MDDAVRHHSNSWWWVKADGCDINKGLKESVKRVWSGDVDLNDGGLQKQYDDYIKRIDQAKKLSIQNGESEACSQLKSLLDDLTKDLEFIHSGNFFCMHLW